MTHQTPSQLPDIILPNQDGTPINLRDSLGQFVVIYFYPKAMTSGCTEQACSIRDNGTALTSKGVTTYGISPDAPKLLTKFKEKESLNFDLLSDSEKTLANLFGSWVEKSMYGRKYMGMSRDIFVFNPQGELISEKRKISPKEHIEFVLKSISHS